MKTRSVKSSQVSALSIGVGAEEGARPFVGGRQGPIAPNCSHAEPAPGRR